MFLVWAEMPLAGVLEGKQQFSLSHLGDTYWSLISLPALSKVDPFLIYQTHRLNHFHTDVNITNL